MFSFILFYLLLFCFICFINTYINNEQALAKRHEADGELEEAAQCRIHLAALVISHLADIKPEVCDISLFFVFCFLFCLL